MSIKVKNFMGAVGTGCAALFLSLVLTACGDDTFSVTPKSNDSETSVSSSSTKSSSSSEYASLSCDVETDGNCFKDLRDGQTYKTVQIGGQVWMAENLNYETATSVLIPEYNGKPREKYGRLYTWDDAMDACPRDWRLPSEEDWNDLIAAAGDSATAGTKLKAARDWDKNGKYTVGTDDFGFAALPAGVSHVNENDVRGFSNNGAYFWTATKSGNRAILFVMRYEKEVVESSRFEKDVWLSVRCIKD